MDNEQVYGKKVVEYVLHVTVRPPGQRGLRRQIKRRHDEQHQPRAELVGLFGVWTRVAASLTNQPPYC
ncbi:hypothetical protein [Streptomyces collinus]|uniref:Uncharacterized protein n=1 Tax=Streptomyces collinus (strain DSM 40733 / Tue 365) TaxID=1214242 RepID=S5W0N1_STRC3|nr:hypothetical protein [Streptomyces collinus]AGS66854.1 hypothetical protein B446_00050 [Streptomyces collinus Tu 365]AGS73840.1 hypothetical protein B446_35240 [Streptomyces collinus Tu 365]